MPDSLLDKRSKASFPDLEDDFASNVIWGGERLNSDYELTYLMPDQVGAIAQVLHTINIKNLLSYFDTSQYNLADWLEDGEAAAHDFKKCFIEAAEIRTDRNDNGNLRIDIEQVFEGFFVSAIALKNWFSKPFPTYLAYTFKR